MNNNRGFSIIEIVIVLVIMGILASLSFVKFQNTMAANDLEKAANNLYLELRGLRPIMFKYDEKVRVKFYPTATPPKFTTEVWVSDTATPAYRIIKTYEIAPPIKIGVPTGVTAKPYANCTGCYWNNIPLPSAPNEVVQGEWKDSLYVNANSRAQYAQGGVFLYNPRLAKMTYFIGINNAMQSIEFKKWDGTQWDNL